MLERFGWQGFIFLVVGRASFFDRRAFIYLRRVAEQRFPLSSFEVSGVWSYRLAGQAAAILVVWVQKWRIPGGGL